MTLLEWFCESKQNKEAIYHARNGRTYIYYRNKKLTKFARELRVEQVVELNDKSGYGAWLYY